ncbi:serine protease inhibitor 42Dd [Scaptodrosophila lebanonensis]|uniref:Serine protease inhibitor 42Dd n=1 Tax=Drosophila lebanonensis TaxID=7225 RepID=A0A6J2UKY3_DROLE|nr:serine protease inhibitor 42Dd [Scaptodrosophila lebanonensis]
MAKNWIELRTTIFLLLAASWLAGGSGTGSSGTSEANEHFALLLSTSLGVGRPQHNVAVSPILLQSALALLYAGAASESPTARELRRALQLQHLGSPGQVVLRFQELMSALKQAPPISCKMRLLSEFYTRQRYTFDFRDEFEVQAGRMGIGTNRLDFDKASTAAERINYDFLTRTNYSVGEVVSAPLLELAMEDTPFLHVSALTFSGAWAAAFDAKETERLNFFSNEHNFKLVDAMFSQHRFKYAEVQDLDARIIELPYDRSSLSLLIVYPNQVTGLTALERKLLGTNLQHLRRQLQERKVALTLPKFSLVVHNNLKETLTQLGMGKMFTDEAQFSNIFSALLSSSAPHLSTVAHTVVLEIDERGGDAGGTFFAAFGDLFRATVPLVINHPFYFVISNEDVVLLAGHIVDI